MSSAARTSTAPNAPVIQLADDESTNDADDESTNDADDESTNDKAWTSWARHMAIATAVALPVLTVLFATAFQAFSDIDATGAYAIAAWASFWGCLFVGGAVGTTVYEVRKHEA